MITACAFSHTYVQQNYLIIVNCRQKLWFLNLHTILHIWQGEQTQVNCDCEHSHTTSHKYRLIRAYILKHTSTYTLKTSKSSAVKQHYHTDRDNFKVPAVNGSPWQSLRACTTCSTSTHGDQSTSSTWVNPWGSKYQYIGQPMGVKVLVVQGSTHGGQSTSSTWVTLAESNYQQYMGQPHGGQSTSSHA